MGDITMTVWEIKNNLKGNKLKTYQEHTNKFVCKIWVWSRFDADVSTIDFLLWLYQTHGGLLGSTPMFATALGNWKYHSYLKTSMEILENMECCSRKLLRSRWRMLFKTNGVLKQRSQWVLTTVKSNQADIEVSSIERTN